MDCRVDDRHSRVDEIPQSGDTYPLRFTKPSRVNHATMSFTSATESSKDTKARSVTEDAWSIMQDGSHVFEELGNRSRERHRCAFALGKHHVEKREVTAQIVHGNHGQTPARECVVRVIPFGPLGIQPDAPVGHEIAELHE